MGYLAEGGLLRVYRRAGGPVASGIRAFIGRCRVRIRKRRLCGRLVGHFSELCKVGQGDEVDVSTVQFFVNSSRASVLLFRRRVKSVADVLKGIRQHCGVSSRSMRAGAHPGALGALDPPPPGSAWLL